MSIITQLPAIAERSEATPGLWNRRHDQLFDNIVSVNSSLVSSEASLVGWNKGSITTNLDTSAGTLSVLTVRPASGNTVAFTGAVSTNTIAAQSGNTVTIPSNLVTSAILRDTADAADNSRLSLCGGGGPDFTRGASIVLYGNEEATGLGEMRLVGGGGVGGIVFYTNNTQRGIITGSAGQLTWTAATVLNGAVTINGTLSASTVTAAQFNLTGRLRSTRTLAASAITASAANTNLVADEIVFTVGGDSGASLAIHSGGTVYLFNSALSAKAT